MAPSALVDELEAKFPNLQILKYKALAPLQIKLRDRTTDPAQFKHYADRLMRYLLLLLLPTSE
jgi:hypothetical protein